MESDAEYESVVIDESADSNVGDAVQSSARLRTRSRLEIGQTNGTKVAMSEER